MKRKCSQCKQEKSIDRFLFQKNRKNHSFICKDCHNKFCHKKWKDRKRKAVELLGGECQICGYKRSLAGFDFHHLDPSKKEAIWNKMKTWSWDKIVEELKKCILLCSNCHREVHSPEDNLELEDQGFSNIQLNRQEIKPSGKCPTCNKEVFGTKYCSVSCSNRGQRKVSKRPTKEQLEYEIKSISWEAIGRKYGVSGTAVKNWAKKYGIKIIPTKHDLPFRTCIVCKKGFKAKDENNVFCSKKCLIKDSRKHIPSKEELEDVLRNNTSRKAAEIFNTSRWSIQRWTKMYNISTT